MNRNNLLKNIVISLLFINIYLFGENIHITGIVKSAESGEPVRGAVVSFKDCPLVTKTKSDGTFEINDTIKLRSFSSTTKMKLSNNLILTNSTIKWGSKVGLKSISLYLLNGKRVFHSVIDNNTNTIKIPELAKGLTILKMDFGNKRICRKIIWGNNIKIEFDIENNGDVKKRSKTNTLTMQINHPSFLTKEIDVEFNSQNVSTFLSNSPSADIFSMDTVYTYSVKIDEAVFDSLEKNAKAEFFVPCTLSFNNEPVGLVGIRYQGSDYHLDLYFDENGKKTNVNKVSLKFKFNEYDINKRFHGLKRLILNAMDTDPTCMRNTLSYNLFNEMGIHSCRTAFARLEINGKYEGLFMVLEPIDSEFLDKRFYGYGDGNLFKEVWPGNANSTDALCNLKTKEYIGDIGGMLAFDSAINQMTTKTFIPQISKWVDLEYLLRFLVVDRAVGSVDGIMTWYAQGKFAGNHNYYWYEENKMDGRFYLLPWDYDATFYTSDGVFDQEGMPYWNEDPVPDIFPVWGDGSTIMAPSADSLIYFLGQTCWDRFVELGEKFLEKQFSKDSLLNKINRWETLIEPHLKDDPNIDSFVEHKEAMSGFIGSIDAFRIMFKKRLAGPDNFEIPDPDLTPFSSYTGLWYDRNNNFEFDIDLSSLPNIYSFASESSVCKIELNKDMPLSGDSDIKLTTYFHPTGQKWEEWAVFNFPMNKSSYDISNVRKILVTAKANKSVNVRFVVNSDAYPDPYGAKYGTAFSIGTESKVYKIDPDLLFYPDWDSQADVKDEVLLTCSGIDISPDASFNDMGFLDDKDTVILQIDDIRFIE